MENDRLTENTQSKMAATRHPKVKEAILKRITHKSMKFIHILAQNNLQHPPFGILGQLHCIDQQIHPNQSASEHIFLEFIILKPLMLRIQYERKFTTSFSS